MARAKKEESVESVEVEGLPEGTRLPVAEQPADGTYVGGEKFFDPHADLSRAVESMSLRDLARVIVDAVSTIVLCIARMRVLVQGGDATPAAGELAAALLDAGGRLPSGRGDELRWFINESPTPLADPTSFGSAHALVVFLLAALKKGRGPDQRLETIASIWPLCNTKAEAEREVGLIESARADAEVREATAMHERVRAAKAAALPKPRPIPIAPHMPAVDEGRPLINDEFDLTVG